MRFTLALLVAFLALPSFGGKCHYILKSARHSEELLAQLKIDLTSEEKDSIRKVDSSMRRQTLNRIVHNVVEREVFHGDYGGPPGEFYSPQAVYENSFLESIRTLKIMVQKYQSVATDLKGGPLRRFLARYRLKSLREQFNGFMMGHTIAGSFSYLSNGQARFFQDWDKDKLLGDTAGPQVLASADMIERLRKLWEKHDTDQEAIALAEELRQFTELSENAYLKSCKDLIELRGRVLKAAEE